jgi:hypothetical protein
MSVPASQSEPAFFEGIIQTCIDQLVQHNSSLLVGGVLPDTWSYVMVQYYERAGIVNVTIEQTDPHWTPDGTPIWCLVDDTGYVASLVTPSSDDPQAKVQLIANGSNAEFELYGKIQDSFGANFGAEDKRTMIIAIYKRSGAKLEPLVDPVRE